MLWGRSSLRAAQLLRVLFLWINFFELPVLKSFGGVFLYFFLQFWFPSWRLFSEPVAVQAPAHWEQLAAQVLLLYLDFQLPFLILPCRFPVRAANDFLPWSFHGLLPFLSVSLSSFVDDTNSTSECSVLSKKRFTLQGFTNLKSQKGNLKIKIKKKARLLDCILFRL